MYAPPTNAAFAYGGPVAPVDAPALARAAGIVWATGGALGLVGSLSLFAFGGGVGMFLAAIVALFCAVFVMVGIQTIRGRAPDTLGNGIGSILFGVFALANVTSPVAIYAIVSVLQGLGLVAAGVMALVVRAQYKAWHAYVKQAAG